jgi:predicted ribosomally synthesized peptide with nif11-like leader
MKNLNPEMIEKAKAAKSAEEILSLAKANGVEMTADEAATYFAQLNPKIGELSDDDLDNVAGGASGCRTSDNYLADNTLVRVINGDVCPQCGGTIGNYFRRDGADFDSVLCKDCKKGIHSYIITQSYKGLVLGVDFELI